MNFGYLFIVPPIYQSVSGNEVYCMCYWRPTSCELGQYGQALDYTLPYNSVA